ncbi:DNA polymerase III polC-type [Cyphomyrmex costatus]|uniref:DNA polymerase III polC-type n=1 Tax=Cyphomyrmex costatus TaxID=456900 RepID=A0A151ICN1_9HYME|nr:DNA polymerase III polC-type [Cyphomyrmex costatus]
MCKVVLFDLETTGLSKNDEISQIAAYTKESSYDMYIIPSKGISKGASAVTGLHGLNGELYLRENRVQAVSASQAFQQFLQYLDNFKRPIILAAHNGFRFDTPRIMKLACEVRLIDQFKTLITGFADTLHIARKLLPERRKNKLKFSIEALATEFVPSQNLEALHNATDDVITLQKILDAVGITDEIIKKNTKTIQQLLQEERNETTISTNKESLKLFKENISASMINKIAKAGLNKLMLQQAFEKGGCEGIRVILGESVNGKARVTTNKKEREY